MQRVTVGLAAVALLVLLIGGASPATAANMNGLCELGEVCVYQHIFGGGFHLDYDYDDADFRNDRFWRTGTSVDNQVSSVGSWDPIHLGHFYRHPGYSGHLFGVDPLGGFNILPVGNDQSSSLYNDPLP
jgi:hypothetical protein